MDVCIELPRPWQNELATVEMNYFRLQDTRRDRFAALNREEQGAEQGGLRDSNAQLQGVKSPQPLCKHSSAVIQTPLEPVSAVRFTIGRAKLPLSKWVSER